MGIFWEVVPAQVVHRVVLQPFFVLLLLICSTMTEKSVTLTAKLVGLPDG
jgi:hypothetical protein